jgi:hypothetical protein
MCDYTDFICITTGAISGIWQIWVCTICNLVVYELVNCAACLNKTWKDLWKDSVSSAGLAKQSVTGSQITSLYNNSETNDRKY